MEDVKPPRAQKNGAEMKNYRKGINVMLMQITSSLELKPSTKPLHGCADSYKHVNSTELNTMNLRFYISCVLRGSGESAGT